MISKIIAKISAAQIEWLCALLVMVIGLLALLGWSFGLSRLASIRHDYIPMAPSAALCFLCIGAALIMSQYSLRFIPRLLAATVLLVACAKVLEVLLGIHLGIDEWLVRDPTVFGSVHTGRMSPITALNLVLIAAGTFSLTDANTMKMAGPFGTLAALTSAVVIMGYLYGTPLLYGGTIIPVALTTALAFLFSSIALVAGAGPQARPMCLFLDGSTRALLLRSFLPVIVAVILVYGWVRATLLTNAVINPAFSSAIAALFFALIIAGIISNVSAMVGGRIDQAEEARNRAQADLLALNSHLEQLVLERTCELRKSVADLQQSREELKTANLQLVQAEKMETVGRMAAGVAHEVQNPLQILTMSLDYLSQRLVSARDAVLDGVLNEMRNAAKRADTIVRGLLDFSHSDRLELTPHDLTPLIQNALSLVRPHLNSNKIALQTELGTDLPPLAVDGVRIEQVFVHLFHNAIDAMPKGGTLSVKARMERLAETQRDAGSREAGHFYAGDKVVVVEVEDTGSGIPPEVLRKIFDPFFTTKATGKGTGLGLTIAKRIVDLHGANIQIRNRPGGGVNCLLLFRTRERNEGDTKVATPNRT
jgi:signal transduction histidine kinase